MCTCKGCMMKEEEIMDDQKLRNCTLLVCVHIHCVYIPAGNMDTSQTVCQSSFDSRDECESTVCRAGTQHT